MNEPRSQQREWWNSAASSGGFSTSDPQDAIELGSLWRNCDDLVKRDERKQQWKSKAIIGVLAALGSSALGLVAPRIAAWLGFP